jgi:reactive intermediate/imine deaminase
MRFSISLALCARNNSYNAFPAPTNQISARLKSVFAAPQINRTPTFMTPLFHLLADAPKPVAPYSHAVEVGGFVFVTGQLATDPVDDDLPMPEGIGAQTIKVMSNLTRVLSGLGLGLEHIVSVRVFLTSFDRDYAAMNTVYASYFPPDRRPARTTVGVNGLARGGLIEIDMVAARP